MYEKSHYLKAIKACKDFKSKYPDIQLVSETEFFSQAPKEFKGNATSSDSAHKLMLERLNYELFQVVTTYFCLHVLDSCVYNSSVPNYLLHHDYWHYSLWKVILYIVVNV